MRALEYTSLVMIPHWPADKETASPSSPQMARLRSAAETVSPVASSTSRSRSERRGAVWRASSSNLSVESPIAETTATTAYPCHPRTAAYRSRVLPSSSTTRMVRSGGWLGVTGSPPG